MTSTLNYKMQQVLYLTQLFADNRQITRIKPFLTERVVDSPVVLTSQTLLLAYWLALARPFNKNPVFSVTSISRFQISHWLLF